LSSTAKRRHDHDAGGEPELLAAKSMLRDEVWAALRAADVARFPGAEHRIPNFVGAEAAAQLLRATAEWEAASTLKANPDSPQLPVRQRALEDGKTVFMARPRLAARDPFIRLDPERLTVPARRAASITGAAEHGVPVDVDELEPVDIAVVGCVAVDERGSRLGKGGGFSDLEYAIAWEAGLVTSRTVVATTVHEVQVLAEGTIPLTRHDIRLDLIVTPDRVIRCRRGRRSQPGVRWDELTDEKIAAIPLLQRLRERAARRAR
jgi:5-formyltetrahydrofolate cyclo-ligase